MQIAILGGYGNTGRRIASLLSEFTTDSIVLIGRNGQKAKTLANEIAQRTGKSIIGYCADCSNPDSLFPILKEVDILIVAAATVDSLDTLIPVLLETKTDYLDINLSSIHKSQILSKYESEILKQKRCFISDGGFHPGVPAALVRYIASKISKLDHAHVGGSFQLKWNELELSQNTIHEFAAELTEMKNGVYLNRKWVSSWKNVRWFDFGSDAGRQKCFPYLLDEMKELPELLPDLQSTGFYIAGFSPILDNLILPISYGLSKILPQNNSLSASFLYKGLQRFASQKEWAILKLEGKGTSQDGEVHVSLMLSHSDPYDFTAIPVVACLKQYLRGKKDAGIWKQALFVKPEQFLQDLSDMGVKIEFQVDPCVTKQLV